MMCFAEELAMGWGVGGVRVSTDPGNRPMLGLLEKCGYDVCGLLTAEKGELLAALEKRVQEWS